MNAKAHARAARILKIARKMASDSGSWQVSNRIEEIMLHTGYAEPGHSTPESGLIATGNWNEINKWNSETRTNDLISDLPVRVLRLFEKLRIECEWADEWAHCCECTKLFRISADSYSWQPSYVFHDGEVTCHECVDPEAHLESLEGTQSVNTISEIDPADHGYIKLEECATGWYPGQNDDPEKVSKDLRSKGVERFIFNLDENQQFATHWSVWVHESEKALLEPETDE